MNRRTFNSSLLRTAAIAAALFLAAALSAVHAQTPAPTIDPAAADANAGDFRTETRKVDGGAELVTIFARRDTEKRDGARREIPLVSVLRDTLGDDDPQNDRIRYVWTLTHPKPSLNQKVAASIPFFYNRAGNKVTAGNKAPPAALDLTPSYKGSFDKIAKFAINTFVVGLFDYPVRAPYRRYNFNRGLYKDSSLATASTVLEYYDAERSDNALASDDVSDIQARAKLNGEMFGWHISNDLLPQIDESAVEKERDIRSHNWELLRQYSDHQDVYFEPLKMPDGQARMAIVWTSAEDVEKNRGRKFDKRFFNIKSPWNDAKLAGWRGYTETRWFDQDGRRVAEGTPGSYSRRMIPLAVYGLDHPKIPILLVDMRKSGNPQMRELTRPLINDVFGAARAYTGLGWITSLLGRNVIGFFTGRRGEDIYQSSRVRSIAQFLHERFDAFSRLLGRRPVDAEVADEKLCQLLGDIVGKHRLHRLPAVLLAGGGDDGGKIEIGADVQRNLLAFAPIGGDLQDGGATKPPVRKEGSFRKFRLAVAGDDIHGDAGQALMRGKRHRIEH